MLLGSPIGPSPYSEAIVTKLVGKIREILSRLSDFEDSQMEITLLRSCLAVPKVAYILRPNLKGFRSFDGLMRDALSDLARDPLPDWSWLKASLPFSLGGLNIRQASLLAPVAYIRFYQQCRPLN